MREAKEPAHHAPGCEEGRLAGEHCNPSSLLAVAGPPASGPSLYEKLHEKGSTKDKPVHADLQSTSALDGAEKQVKRYITKVYEVGRPIGNRRIFFGFLLCMVVVVVISTLFRSRGPDRVSEIRADEPQTAPRGTGGPDLPAGRPAPQQGEVAAQAPEASAGPAEPTDADGSGKSPEELAREAEVKQVLKDLRAEKMRILLEQASRKQRLQEVLSRVLAYEAELSGLQQPSDAEIERETERAVRNADIAAEQSLIAALSHAAPFLSQSKRLYKSLESRISRAQERAKTMAVEETKSFVTDVAIIYGLQDTTDLDFSFLRGFNMPSIAALIASALAPAQLRMVHGLNLLMLLLSVLFVLLDLIVLVSDWRAPCMNIPLPMPSHPTAQTVWNVWWHNARTNVMYMWFLVDFVVHFICCIIRMTMKSRVGAVLENISGAPPVHLVDHPVEAVQHLLDFYLTTGCKALLELDIVLGSSLLYLASWSVFFDVCWLIYGTDLVWNTPMRDCSDVGTVILRIRSTTFLIFSIGYILQLVLLAAGQIVASNSFAIGVLRIADGIDDGLQLGVPVAKVLCHALVVRSSADMIAIQLNISETEREQLEGKRAKLAAELEKVVQEDAKHEEQIQRLREEQGEVGTSWKSSVEQQEKMEEFKAQMVESSTALFNQVKERVHPKVVQAQQEVETWEEGESPVLISSLARGDTVLQALSQATGLDEAAGGRMLAEARAAGAATAGATEALAISGAASSSDYVGATAGGLFAPASTAPAGGSAAPPQAAGDETASGAAQSREREPEED